MVRVALPARSFPFTPASPGQYTHRSFRRWMSTFQSGLPIPLFTAFLASLHMFSLWVPWTMYPRNDLYWCLPFVFVSFKRRNSYSKALARKFHWRAANSRRFDPRPPRHSILTTWPCASSTSIAVSVLYSTKQTARTRSTSLTRRSQCWYYTVRHYNVDRNVGTIRYKSNSKDQEYVTTTVLHDTKQMKKAWTPKNGWRFTVAVLFLQTVEAVLKFKRSIITQKENKQTKRTPLTKNFELFFKDGNPNCRMLVLHVS